MKAQKVIDLLKENHRTISAVESMTGGMLSALFTEVPGASEVFKGAIVAYSAESKMALADVKSQTIQNYGLISWETASEMAYNGRIRLATDYCVSITGNAGPSVDHGDKEVGTVYIAIASGEYIWGIPLNLTGTREQIKKATLEAVISALENILK
ncbi:MAG: CinA family protein [Bacilli bacterium]|jgi:nicotinamide-nucleotide amidase